MKNYIYLIGQISFRVKETYDWRDRVDRYFKNLPNFETFNPCVNEFNISGNGSDINLYKAYETKGIDVLVPKDKTFVLKSTMAFANLNTYDIDKPIIGTMFELAWYHDHPDKTVIGIFNGDPKQDKICNHPFVKSVVNTWVTNEKEACELVMRYFAM